MDWLDKNADKTVDEIMAESTAASAQTDPDAEPPLKPGEQPLSLVCNDCGAKLRSHAAAEYHAGKTQHINFSESTEEIKPLTEEEKAEKLAELKRKLAEKRAVASGKDKEDQKRNEVIKITPKFAPCHTKLCVGDPAEEHERISRYQRGSAEEGTNQGGREEASRKAGGHRS